MSGGHPPTVVHLGETSARWTTVNAREAFPGVITPLTYTFFFPGTERAIVRFWKDLGLLERRAPAVATEPDGRFVSIFLGRFAMNVDRYGEMADRTPGTSAVGMEEQMFGVARSRPVTTTRRRYPVVALRAPRTVVGASRATLRNHAPNAAWRQRWLGRLSEADPATASDAFQEARGRLETVLQRHIMLTAVTQAAYDAVADLARVAGMPGAELDLTTSPTGTDETAMIDHLRAVAGGERSLGSFIDEYGFHGPREGHLDGAVWRVDPAPVTALLERYRTARALDVSQSRRRRAQRVAELMAALPRRRRPMAHAVLRFAARMPALREQGKAQFLQVVDVGRAASAVLGKHLTDSGVLDTPDDVFFLTAEELLGEVVVDRSTISERRREHETFLSLDLPEHWTGNPVAIPLRDRNRERTPAGTTVTGMGVSSGRATGQVRVLGSPDDDFAPDEILVCNITDPSWAAVMAIAAAIVIDVGGPISHGAIVARELGIPCVASTGDGSLRLHDGDTVTVDGTAGTVVVTRPACSQHPA